MDDLKMKQDHICRIVPLNPSDAVCNHAAYKALLPYFSWESQVWIQGPFAKTAKKYREHCFHSHEKIKNFYYFPAGLIDKAIRVFEEKKFPYKVTSKGFMEASTDPEMPGLKLRDNQIKAIAAATRAGRGIIQAATASGKTIISYGIFQAYLQANEGEKCLFLAHTIDLVKQAAKQFRDLGAKVGIWQGKERTDGDIICSTIQTLSKIDLREYQEKFICLIVDEVHHCASFDGKYFSVIQDSFTVARFGVTATLPNKPEGILAAEALLGPVIDSYSISDGIKDGILSKPKIFFVPYDGSHFMGDMKSYKDIYEKNIVRNVSRNKKIARMAISFEKKGESSLIFVRHIDHGERLSKILKEMDCEHLWVHGKSEKDERVLVKETLEKKKVKVVICSTIWNEGISIKSLNNCILAGGGKDEKMVLQVVGRGTRVDEGKNTVNIWDFLDPQKYLSQHCIERMIVYRDQGWDVRILKKKEK
jgi:superfamily II DNA or RNA helicase